MLFDYFEIIQVVMCVHTNSNEYILMEQLMCTSNRSRSIVVYETKHYIVFVQVKI